MHSVGEGLGVLEHAAWDFISERQSGYACHEMSGADARHVRHLFKTLTSVRDLQWLFHDCARLSLLYCSLCHLLQALGLSRQ